MKKNDALIGLGLVGSTLHRELDFTDIYTRSNILDIRGKEYDTIYCAGLPAEKWKANQDPESDLLNLKSLLKNLLQAKCNRFVLYSTIDIYNQPAYGTEDSIPCPKEAYGKHRYALEACVSAGLISGKFNIIRLPALFGKGLKKNFLYDILNQKDVSGVNANSTFQWYNLDNLVKDTGDIITLEHKVTNLTSTPITAGELYKHLTMEPFYGKGKLVEYNVSSSYRPDGVWYNKESILRDITDFYVKEIIRAQV
jgi:nucleoside-diphosphate-sugar epimerase